MLHDWHSTKQVLIASAAQTIKLLFGSWDERSAHHHLDD
jgi:hypothetical protein